MKLEITPNLQVNLKSENYFITVPEINNHEFDIVLSNKQNKKLIYSGCTCACTSDDNR